MEIGTFPDYQAVTYHISDAAEHTHGIMGNVRNSKWELDETYVYEGIFPPFFLFLGLGIIQLIFVPIWLCMYKRGKISGCSPCCSSYIPSKRTMGIAMGFIFALALVCIVLAIVGATQIHNGMDDASEETCYASILLGLGGQVIHPSTHISDFTKVFNSHNFAAARPEVDYVLDRYLSVPVKWAKTCLMQPQNFYVQH